MDTTILLSLLDHAWIALVGVIAHLYKSVDSLRKELAAANKDSTDHKIAIARDYTTRAELKEVITEFRDSHRLLEQRFDKIKDDILSAVHQSNRIP